MLPEMPATLPPHTAAQAHSPSSAVLPEVIAAANTQGAVNLQTGLSAAFPLHLNQFHLRKKKKSVCFS